MDCYKDALDAYLRQPGINEADLAEQVSRKQATINRYRNGKRFPDADTARLIDDRTGGKVPFELWQREFLARSGIAA